MPGLKEADRHILPALEGIPVLDIANTNTIPSPTTRDTQSERFQPRNEVRFGINPTDVLCVQEKLLSLGYRQIEYSRPGVRNIHLTSRRYETPNGGYIRLRQYVPSGKLDETSFTLRDEEKWMLEMKPSGEGKERIEKTLAYALYLVNEDRQTLGNILPTSIKMLNGCDEMIPVASSQWERSHYVTDASPLRITLDQHIRYFGFIPGEMTARFMGRQDIYKLEIKGSSTDFDEKQTSLLQNLRQVVEMQTLPDNWQEKEMRNRYANVLIQR